jgi:SAM-dependent methyltransferase
VAFGAGALLSIMDPRTLAAYDREAGAFAQDWETQPAPSDLHDIVRRFFAPGPTADIGCGSGRDAAWLDRNGFPASGYDASERLLAEARRLHPGIEFRHATLPELRGISTEAFTNVLCETVIMHLPRNGIVSSIKRLLAILQPGGTLYLSWRVTEGADLRDEHGRLYAAFDPALVFHGLASADVLLNEEAASVSSGKKVHRVVARKTSLARA